MTPYLYFHIVGGAITLYMLLIGIRWFAPYIELELSYGRFAWVPRLTDPPIELSRKLLGQTTGPFDWAPIVTLLVLWIIRIALVRF